MFQGNIERAQHNYPQYIYSYVPEKNPGGGGWSLMVYSLGSLYEDYDHMQNVWTSSNVGLPLVRYTGCTITLYQSENTDYVFIYDRCWPMVDTPHTHADSSPSRVMQRKSRIIMPSKQTHYRKKPYKRIKIKPPHEMQNKWYFQKDIADIPLLMTTATAVSLTQPLSSKYSLSNNLIFTCLNPFIFSNPNFQHFPETTGYSHKILNNFSMYLYASRQAVPNSNEWNVMKPFLEQLIFLGNTKENQPGKEFSQFDTYGGNKKQNWGNPFYYRYLEHTPETSYKILTTKTTSLNIEQAIKANAIQSIKNTDFQETTGPIAYKVTYNPIRDTGLNKIYLIKTDSQINLDEPSNPNLIFEGFTLYNLIWGWTDFIKKLKIITNIDNNTLLAIKTKVFDDTILPVYIPIDEDFLEGYDPYQPHDPDILQTNWYHENNWFPKLTFQEQTINKIALTSPFAPQNKGDTYLQSLIKYRFYFKWGGCPKQLEKAFNPSLQPKWTTPDNLQSRLTIQNPNESPRTELYYWDWDNDYVKETAIERIKEHTLIDENLLFPTETKFSAKALKKQEKEDSAPKEEKNLFIQLHKLRQQRMHLELQCKLQLMELKSKTQK